MIECGPRESPTISCRCGKAYWPSSIIIVPDCQIFVKSDTGLYNWWQPGSPAARKWRENEKMKRKRRECEEVERKWRGNEEMKRE